jgi:hypothetical protein
MPTITIDLELEPGEKLVLFVSAHSLDEPEPDPDPPGGEEIPEEEVVPVVRAIGGKRL